jgi:hypothetical protein
VNTHIDFFNGPYKSLSAVISALQYLGLPNVRDNAANPGDLSSWQRVAQEQETGVKFDDYIGELPPSVYGFQANISRLAAGDGLLNAIEGPNEPEFGGFLRAAVQQSIRRIT